MNAGAVRLLFVSICIFKHAAALRLDVDIQAATKARVFSRKQHHKTIKRLAMDRREVLAFL
ncbi:hypothetical protein CEV08_03355 [Bartonella tribocorum]|uniref:Uncharacterized protein n=1 Tax=Bartonella tribocorum TaxID=85701 RepID=A0A2M6UWI0_9HYPH|nr:hypothetical protein CEV08_03355 [Bartonella tribocorum]